MLGSPKATGGAQPTPSPAPAPAVQAGGQPPIGPMQSIRNALGGFLPEKGSQGQLDMVKMLASGGMQAAQGSNSPLLALLAPMLGAGAMSRAQGSFEDRQGSEQQASINKLMSAMNTGPDGIRDLITLMSDEDTSTGLRSVANTALSRAMAPPVMAGGGSGGGRVAARQYRNATPEEAASYGAQFGQFAPNGRFYPMSGPSGGDAGVLRQRNEATGIIQDAIQSYMSQGFSQQEAQSAIAQNPLYKAQYQILGIEPSAMTAASTPTPAPEPSLLEQLMGAGATPTPAQPAAPAPAPANDPLGIRANG